MSSKKQYLLYSVVLASALFGIFLLYFYKRDTKKQYDLTLVGHVRFADGLGRYPIWIIDCLKDTLSINRIPTENQGMISDLSEVPPEVIEVLKEPSDSIGNVVLFTDLLWLPGRAPTHNLPEEGHIKIAYSMFESTSLPTRWVDILNTKFDAVVVPDEWLVDTYTNSGVKIPVFVLPLGLYLEEFLAEKQPTKAHKPFIFGNTCTLELRKNHIRLIEAFHKAFGNSQEVKLVINARATDFKIGNQIKDLLDRLAVSNIDIRLNPLSRQEYLTFMKSIDCYVTLSKGEGFSVPPREAMALGIPVILSNNTAHQTLCATNLVKAVPATVRVPLPYNVFEDTIGYGFDCTIDEAAASLKDVYTHYDVYLAKAQEARKWVKQYLKENLKQRYLNLVKPQKIILGSQNSITDQYLMTNSKLLYKKYTTLRAP